MAIFTMTASKATPGAAIDYITDKKKSKYFEGWRLDPGRSYAEQMMEKAKIWGKNQGEDDRKYYHFKISFAPEDWDRNGGKMTESDAFYFGMDFINENFTEHEAVLSVHTDKNHLHVHGIVNSVNLSTGKKLDIRNADYKKLKDRVQEMCRERELTDIDWREATKTARMDEKEPEGYETITFAEKGLRERGKAVWKDDLRSIIDQAAAKCSSMDEFKAVLESQGVTLTRCTEKTISYKMGEHRACRGDTLGGDYTAEAIWTALEHNQEDPDLQKKMSLDDLIGGNGNNHVISMEERQMIRELGRLAGFKRTDIDGWCDVPEATWEEKQAIWDNYKSAKIEFWEEYNIRQQALKEAADDVYRRRREIRNAEWALENSASTLLGAVFVTIYLLLTTEQRSMIEAEIAQLKWEREKLRKDVIDFKSETNKAADTLREKGLSLDDYLRSVKRMQDIAEQIQQDNSVLIHTNEREVLQREKDSIRQSQEWR